MPTSPPIHRQKGYKPREKWTRSPRDKTKTTSQRGYGWHWQKIRKQIISRDKGLCQSCLKVGRVTAFNDVDHITSKAQGGNDAAVNLQCICKQCHKVKTQTDNRGEGGSKLLT